MQILRLVILATDFADFLLRRRIWARIASRGSMRGAGAATGHFSYGFRGFPASQAHIGADCFARKHARGSMRDAVAATVF
jgi:hypothetical protein